MCQCYHIGTGLLMGFYRKAYSRSSHYRCSVKKAVGKQIHRETPVSESQLCNFIKKKLQHRCFPVKFEKFLKTPILKNICERLLLIFMSRSLVIIRLKFISNKSEFAGNSLYKPVPLLTSSITLNGSSFIVFIKSCFTETLMQLIIAADFVLPYAKFHTY